MAPCDNERYGLLGCNHYHDNCRDNMHAALLELGLVVPYTPASLNIFMNIPWQQDGSLVQTSPLGDRAVSYLGLVSRDGRDPTALFWG